MRDNWIKALFKPVPRGKMPMFFQVITYVLAGVGFLSLLAALRGYNETLCRLGASVGIFGMILVRMITGFRYNNENRYYLLAGLVKDILFALAWLLLLLYWINNPASSI